MILVTGATGNVGRELVGQLVERGARVRAMTRRPATARFPYGVEVVRGDFDDDASLESAMTGVERMFLMSAQPVGSATAPTHDLRAATIAGRMGVKHIVKMSVLGTATSGAGDLLTEWHRQAEDAVVQSGVAWTFLRPGRFMSNALQWATMIRQTGKVVAPFGNKPAASIDPSDIAGVAVVALTEGGHEERAYALSGPEALTPLEEVAILSRVLDRPIAFEHLPAEAARSGMLRSGMSPEVVAAVMERIETDDSGAEVLPTVERVTNRPARRFADWARAHAEAFL